MSNILGIITTFTATEANDHTRAIHATRNFSIVGIGNAILVLFTTKWTATLKHTFVHRLAANMLWKALVGRTNWGNIWTQHIRAKMDQTTRPFQEHRPRQDSLRRKVMNKAQDRRVTQVFHSRPLHPRTQNWSAHLARIDPVEKSNGKKEILKDISEMCTIRINARTIPAYLTMKTACAALKAIGVSLRLVKGRIKHGHYWNISSSTW